jgi:hypothetical protein
MSLNEHWFPSLLHARTEIERWRGQNNEERSKKVLGGLTPAVYATQLKQLRTPNGPATQSGGRRQHAHRTTAGQGDTRTGNRRMTF